MSMAVSARAPRRWWETIAWSLLAAWFVATVVFLGSVAVKDLSKRGTRNCRTALGLEKGTKAWRTVSKEFSFDPLGWRCVVHTGGSAPVSSFVEL